jgi:hypothetical protein
LKVQSSRTLIDFVVCSGLFSFASTTLILSLYNARARDIHHPNVVLGMAIFCGGIAQLLAGMWEFPRGNTFASTGEHLSFSKPTFLAPLQRRVDMTWRFCANLDVIKIKLSVPGAWSIDLAPWRRTHRLA